ncbi:hypothetical protein [Arthrobacter oryzae]|uniref:hypothetical protein n=1 Tax=Arthrobacter oryzae TaxID=409290 RepID=UPI0027806972|nr:hypothetical protein [Arthrobacter oryzae]MDQ0078566.1 hypothetical protein [Arthrobacter oryzae]
MSLKDKKTLDISDRASFDTVTGGGFEVAGLYTYARLDPLIELACQVAGDFLFRPHLYVDLQAPTTLGLARLRARVGYDENFPSYVQRKAMYEPVFGPSDSPGATSDFVRLRDGLLAAASTFAEWSQATGIPMLRERVRTEHRPFRDYLAGVSGASVTWSRSSSLQSIADDHSYPILRDKDVIAVFGLTGRPEEQWPYRTDSNGDKLVEEISKALELAPERRLTREGFSALQRVAHRGGEAITAVMLFDESQGDDELAQLITRCYTWNAALKAWHEPGSLTGRRGGNS